MPQEVRGEVNAVLIDEHETRLRVIVLGALTVELDGKSLHVAGSHRRRLLAFMAGRPGRVVPIAAIVDALWGEDPPPSAAKTIHSHVMRLRRSLAEVGGDVLETVPTGYRLNIEPAAVDAVRFEHLASHGRRELERGREASAAATLVEALAMWRGPAYVEFREAGFAAAEEVRLNELRLGAMEDLAQAQLSTGGAANAVAELERLVVEEPGRERAWALLMRALYAAGRQPHALAAFRRARRALVDEFGLEPGAELRTLERQIYEQDPALAVATAHSQLPPALRASTPLLGRAGELSALRQAWEIALRGSGRMCVLFGAVGSGRTRLAGEFAADIVGSGAWVDYVRGADGFGSLRPAGGEQPLPGAVVDAVTDRCRRGPLLLVVDDAEWMAPAAVEAVASLASAVERLTILVLLIADPTGGGPAIKALRHLPGAVDSTIGLLANEDVASIVAADGVDADSVSTIVALAGGMPGIARREAAAWAERAASERLQVVAASSMGAVATSDVARASVFDEVLRLVGARTRRDELISSSWAGRQPYRALASYGPEDADLFVGREGLLAELAARMLDRRLVAVVGASGSGKSSLVRAGLIPLVRSGRLPGLAPWRTHVIVPGDDPQIALDGIAELDEPGPQLLVVDQFEEALASSTTDAFAGRIVDLALDAALDVHVVVVVRADRYAMVATIRRLAELVDDAQVLVGPPTEDELRRIIEVPAWRTGCVVEPALVTLIADDVAGHDALPLISAALAEVWEQRDGDTLRAARYVEIGGIAAAVERLGARAIERAGDAEGIHQVMVRLVDVTDEGQWTRRRISVDALPSALAPAVAALVDERLVVRDGGTVEVVHEVVFRAWPLLAAWLEEVRTQLVLDRELRAAARTWATQGRRDDDVLRGARLAAAAEFVARRPDVPAVVDDFVSAGRRLAEREHEQVGAQLAREVRARRRLSRALAAAALLLVLTLVGGTLAVVSQRRADDERQRAAAAAALAEQRQSDAEHERDGAQIARLVAESERELDAHLDRALLLAVEARRRDDNPETQGALLTAITHNLTSERDPSGSSPAEGAAAVHRTNSAFLGFLAGPVRQQYDVDASDDGRIVASAGLASNVPPDGMTLVFDTVQRTEIGRIESESMFLGVDVSNDGRYVLTFDHFHVHLFDTAVQTTTVLTIPPPAATSLDEVDAGATSIADVHFRPDGEQFLVVTSDGELSLWNRAGVTPIDARLPDAPSGYVGPRRAAATGMVDFQPDGTLSVVQQGGDGMTVIFWDIDRGEAARTVQLEDPGTQITGAAVSPAGALLAGYQTHGQAFVWNLATGQLRGDPAVRPGSVRGIAFDPASPTTLALGNAGGGIALYDLGTEQPLGDPLRGHGSGIQNLAYNADGHYLFTVADDGLVGIWGDNRTGGLVADQLAPDVSTPEASADGSRVLVRIAGDRLQMRDGADLQSPGVEIVAPAGTALLPDWQTYALSADGSTVVAWADGDPAMVFVADAATGRTTWSSSNAGFGSTVASLSPDGSRLVVVDEAYTRMRLWDLTTGQPAGDATVADIDDDADGSIFNGRPQFSPDGKFVDIATFHGVARFSAADLRPVLLTATTFNLQGDVDHVPGSDDVIAAGIGGQIARWDMSTGELVASGRSRDSSSLLDVAVSPDGSLVASVHVFSHQLAIFDATTLRPVGEPFPVGDLLFTPQFTPDGLIGNGLFNDITSWEMNPAGWQQTACYAAGRNLTRDEWAEYIGTDEPYRSTCP